MKHLTLITLAALLAATATASGSSVTLEWQDNSTNEAAFEVERSVDQGQTWESRYVLPMPDGSTTGPVQWTDADLQPGATYAYRVRGANEYGYSGYTNTVTYTAPSGPNADPSGLIPTAAPVLRFTSVDGRTAIVEIVGEARP